MISKLNILMICSWVRHDSNVGIFFREQAKHLSSSFDIYLASFIPVHLGIRSLLRTRSLFKIEEVQTPEGLLLYYVSFPSFYFFPNRINEALKNIAVKKLNRILIKKSFKPNLIHAQSIFDAGFWAHKVYKKFNIPYIITEHNQLSLKDRNFKQINYVLNDSLSNLVVSKDLIRQFAINGFFHEFSVIGNCFDENIFYPNSINRKTDVFSLITIGAYCPIKDQETILKALKTLDNYNVKIKFTWVGFNSWGIDQTIILNELLKKYNFLNVEIELVPTATHQSIREYLRKNDIYVCSSISETFGISVLESLACGIPVVTTQCGGINETVIHEKNGLIVPVKSSSEMATAIFRIIKKDIIFDNLEIANSVNSKFSKSSFTLKMKEYYNLFASQN